MNKLLVILTIFCLFLLSSKGEKIGSDGSLACPEETEELCSPHDGYSSSPCLFSFNKESKYELSLSSRTYRNSSSENERAFKTMEKLFESFLLKESNTLQHISETIISVHILKYSTLRHEAGYLVFALRKILI